MFDQKQYCSPSDCGAKGTLDKVACRLRGPKWEQYDVIRRQDLPDILERCKRCEVTRMNPGRMA